MPEIIIDLLHSIEIDNAQKQGALLLLCLLQQPHTMLFQSAAVVPVGQFVAVVHIGKFIDQRFHLIFNEQIMNFVANIDIPAEE